MLFVNECIHTNYAFSHSCILYLESLQPFPSVRNPKTGAERAPFPLGRYLSPCFCSPKTLDARQRDAELHSPRSRVPGGLWPSQGPGILWETSLGSQAQRGQTQRCGICAPSARAAPAPAPLAQHPGPWSHPGAGPAAALTRAEKEFSATLSPAVPGRGPWAADTILPLPAIPAARGPSDQLFPTVPCSTREAGMAPQG